MSASFFSWNWCWWREWSSSRFMLWIRVVFPPCVNMHVCVCAHREMDRLGIITPSHQDILIASAQQEMLSQMQHMQHTMVPVWAGGRIQTQKNFFHLPHPCTLEGPCHRWEYDERSEVKVRSEGRRKAALFVNFHTVEFSENPPDADVAADSIKLRRAQTEASSSYPVLLLIILLSVSWRLTC